MSTYAREMTTLPLRPGFVPPLHELGPDIFEALCRDLLQEEPGVKSVDLYGTSGQKQFGVDLLIHRNDGSLWVGQCKSHRCCDHLLLRRSCDDFLAHQSRWSDRGVTTFVLCLAADIRRTQLHDELHSQENRLRQCAFAFTVWSGAILTSKLRKQRPLVKHYLPFHELYICGPSIPLDVELVPTSRTLQTLVRHYGEKVEGDYSSLRRLWRQGYPHEALSKLHEITSDVSSWDTLDSSVKSKLVHLEGRLHIATGNIPAATSCITPPRSADHSGRARLIAMIALAEGRPEDAIAELRDPDPDNQVLRAAAYLQAARMDEALQILSALPQHPDAYQLRASLFLARGEPHNAKMDAERALSIEPTWYWTRRTAAMMRYLAGLSPAATPKALPAWPQPLPFGLVRRDSESTSARRAAAADFHSLLNARFHHSPDDLACLLTWHIACLADHPESRRQAEQVATAVLKADPANYRVVIWVLARDLSVPIDASLRALAATVHHGQAQPEHFFALVGAYATKGNVPKARALLRQVRTRFAIPSVQHLADSWRKQLTTMKALASQSESGRLSKAQLRKMSNRLRDACTQGDHVAGWQQCMVLAQLGHWKEIAPLADDLVTSFQTADSVRLASYALYNTGDVISCLGTLDRAPELFLDKQLPADLRRLRVLAQRDIGAVPEAIRGAADIFADSNSREDFLELCNLHFQMGDMKSLAVAARAYGSIPDLAVVDYLTLASYLKAEDPQFALEVWKAANSKGIDDEQVAVAFEIGTNLGAQTELKALTRRLEELGAAGKAGIRAVGIDEVIRWTTERHERLSEVWDMLRHGTVPIHLIGRATNIPLAHVYHRRRLLTKKGSDGWSAGPIYHRVASSLPGTLQKKRWRLAADVTALLTAAHFGLLPEIETEFAPIRISAATILALTRMQEALRPNQPDRAVARQQLLDLWLAGGMSPFVQSTGTNRAPDDGDVADDVLDLLWYAAENDGVLVEFLPVRSLDPRKRATTLPQRHSRRLRDGHAVVEALEVLGVLSKGEGQDARERLGPRSQIPCDLNIPKSTVVVCGADLALLLAGAGVLEPATTVFDFRIPETDLNRERAARDASVQGTADADWLGTTISRIRVGLENGQYGFLPPTKEMEAPEGDTTLSMDEVVLRDILQVHEDEADIVWIDDRCLNAHTRATECHIADTVDLLLHLRERGRLSHQRVFEILGDMRATDSRFVAFDTEELVAALDDAPVEAGKLIETRRLRTFREYYARCLLDAHLLRPPVDDRGQPNASTEWHFLVKCGAAVQNAMARVWRSDVEEESIARVEWLARNMYTDDRGFYGAASSRSAEADVYRSAVTLAGVFGWGLELDRGETDRQDRRQYFEWVYQRVVRERFVVDPAFASTVISQIKQLVTSTAAEAVPGHEGLAKYLMARLWLDLPEAIRIRTDTDQEFLQRLGVRTARVTRLGPVEVASDALWPALDKALNDGVPTYLRTIEGHIVSFERTYLRPIAFSVRCPAKKVDHRVQSDDFVFLSNSLEVREAGALRMDDWFDIPRAAREKALSTVVAGQDVGARMDAALTARSSSGAVFYRDFMGRLRPGENFRRNYAMPPEVGILIDHIRIRRTDIDGHRWEKGIRNLLADVGVLETAVRICGLPIAIPVTFVEALQELPIRQRRGILRQITRLWATSPVGLVHIVDLWARLGLPSRWVGRVARCLAQVLCSENARSVFDAWLSVLRWVHEQLGFNETTRCLSADVRLGLVWVHGDRVFRILLRHGLEPAWIRRVFGTGEHALMPEFVFPGAMYGDDLASPAFLRAEFYVMAGLGRMHKHDAVAEVVREVFLESFRRIAEEGKARLALAMMADDDRSTNILGSWLSERQSWLAVLPDGSAEHFAATTIRNTARESCVALIAGEDIERSWGNLCAILGNRPPAEGLAGMVERCFRGVSLTMLLELDPGVCNMILGLIGMQASYLSDDCRTRLLETIETFTRRLGSLDVAVDMREALTKTILNALVGCTWAGSDASGEERAMALSAALERLAKSDSMVMFDIVGIDIVGELCSSLPQRQARHFWRVRELLRLRRRW